MAVIDLPIVVAKAEAICRLYDCVKVYRSEYGPGGPFEELTDADTRIALLPTRSYYEYQDLEGQTDWFYQTTFFNSTSNKESRPTDPQKGEGNAALSIISVDELKENWLFGVDLSDTTGNLYDNRVLEFYINAAVGWVERRLDLPLRMSAIKGERYDYYAQDYSQWGALQLTTYPVISVDALRVHPIGTKTPVEVAADWIHLDKSTGQINLIPSGISGGNIMAGLPGALFPFMRGARYVPNLFGVDYTVGFYPGQVPWEIKEIIGKTASLGPLNIAGDLVGGAGVASQSISIDGLSQSLATTNSSTNAGYGARLLEYLKEMRPQLDVLRRTYKQIGFRAA